MPSKPTLTVEGGWDKVRLKASVANDGGMSITKWRYRWYVNNNTRAGYADVPGTNTSIALDAIIDQPSNIRGRTVYYYVRAVSGAGASDESSATARTDQSKPVKASTPAASLSGSNIRITSVCLVGGIVVGHPVGVQEEGR